MNHFMQVPLKKFFINNCLVYSATKSFINTFSEALNTEYKNQGILVQSQLPGLVV